MLASMQTATYDSEKGIVKVVINNSSINGYKNTVRLYQTPNTISVPVEGNLINLDVQADSQLQMTGYNSRITDANFTIASGEFTAYSTNWYLSTRNLGVEVQQVNTANKENLIAGQSTNSVLNDMLGIIIQIVAYMTAFSVHVHPGGTLPSGSTGVVATQPPVPSDTDIVVDQTYIAANKNLFITGTYEPK